MNKEIFERLKKYERPMLTAKRAKYYVGISPKDIENLISIHNTLFPTHKETFTTCNTCVLRILSKLCDSFQAEKNRIEEEAKTAVSSVENQTTQTDAPTAKKKQKRGRKTAK